LATGGIEYQDFWHSPTLVAKTWRKNRSHLSIVKARTPVLMIFLETGSINQDEEVLDSAIRSANFRAP
jgi:hypothetical protein